MDRFKAGQLVRFKKNPKISGEILYPVIDGHWLRYCVLTTQGARVTAFAKDLILADSKPRKRNSYDISEYDTHYIQTLAVLLDSILQDIPKNEVPIFTCLSPDEPGSAEISTSWGKIHSTYIRCKIKFQGGRIHFRDVYLVYDQGEQLSYQGISNPQETFDINLENNTPSMKDNYELFQKTLLDFFRPFDEFGVLIEFLEKYHMFPLSDYLETRTRRGEITWKDESVDEDMPPCYYAEDGSYSFISYYHEDWNPQIAVMSGEDEIGEMPDQDEQVRECILESVGSEEPDLTCITITDIIVHAKDDEIHERTTKGLIDEPSLTSVCLIDHNSLELTEKEVLAYRNQRNGIWFINEETYRQLAIEGILCCRTIKEDTYHRFIETKETELPVLLGQYGYAVDNKKGLPQKERQTLLAFLIDNNILSSEEICRQLNNFIESFGSLKNRKRSAAKWMKDYDYVSSYSFENDELIVSDCYRKMSGVIQDADEDSSEIWIKAEDFVVKENVFRCAHEGHMIRDIDAHIQIIRNNGKLEETVIPAGWCQECRIYFILESTYQELLQEGTLVCRITTAKHYFENRDTEKKDSQHKLKEKSLMREYGYTVSQEEGLSEIRRRAILAYIIDNGILERNRVLSYLDYFITQRKNKANMRSAISKWKSDMAFVSQYNKGTYKAVGIAGLRVRV